MFSRRPSRIRTLVIAAPPEPSCMTPFWSAKVGMPRDSAALRKAGAMELGLVDEVPVQNVDEARLRGRNKTAGEYHRNSQGPQVLPVKPRNGLNYCKHWRPRQDSNLRPTA
jgi:hypothetical protein